MRTGALSQAYGIRLLFKPRVQRALLITLLVVFLAVRAFQFFAFTGVIQWGYDLSAYWRAAQAVLDGGSPYAPFQLAGAYSPQQQFLYVYPPFLAVLVAPLAAVVDDYRLANWLWAALGAAILAVVVVLVARRERLARGFDLFLLVVAAFAYAPVVSELIIGNVHLLILGLLAGAWLALGRRSVGGDTAAGVLVAVAALIKVFPVLLVLWFLVTGRIRAAVASLVAMVVLVLATLPVTGLGPWLDYPTVLANLGPPTELTDVLAPTVWLAAVMPPLVAQALVTLVGIAVVVWAARQRSEPVSFAVAVTVCVLIAPALYPHYLAILVLPMLLALRYAPPAGWVGLVWLSAMGGGPEVFGDAAWIVNRAVPALGAVVLIAGLIRFGRQNASPAREGLPAAEADT
jgi:alpha-1,2-mannosyltransferase